MTGVTEYAVNVEGEPDTDAPPLAPVSLHDLHLPTLRPVEFALEPLLPLRVASVLGAHGGMGKSVLALTWAAHVALGRAWGPFDVPQAGPALFVSLEDEGELVKDRLRRIAREYRLHPAELQAALRLLDGSEAVTALACSDPMDPRGSLIPTAAMRQVREAAEGCRLVVVDNSSLALQADANRPELVYRFVATLAAIGRQAGAAVLALNHVDKQAARHGSRGETYSGSAAWNNSARSRMALIRTEGGQGIELVHEKANLTRLAEPVFLRFTDAGVIVPTSANEANEAAQQAEALTNGDDDRLVFEAIRNACEVGQNVTTSMSGSNTTLHFLQSAPELPEALKIKSAARRLRAALLRLEREGAIVREQYRTEQRNGRERWRVPRAAA